MMTCAECLSAVLVADRAGLEPTSPVGEHCATCENCRRVVTDVRNREQRVAAMLDDVRAFTPPSLIAEEAMRADRRATAHYWRMGLLIAFLATLGVGVVKELQPLLLRTGAISAPEPVITATVPLKCVTPEQAMSLATPYLRSAAAIYTTPGIPAVTIRGKRREFDQALKAIEEFDVACQLPPATTKEPATSPAKPGKD